MKYLLFIFVILLTLFIVSCGDDFTRGEIVATVPIDKDSFQDDINTQNDVSPNTEQDQNIIIDNNVVVENEQNETQDTTTSPVCGNKQIEIGEQCDGNSKQCSALLGSDYEGTANCKSDCTGFDTSTCTKHQTKTVYKVNSRCVGCAKCVRRCSYNAIQMIGGIAVIDPKKCTGCGDCVSACRYGAIEKTTY